MASVKSGNAYADPTPAQLGKAGALAREAGYGDVSGARRAMHGKNKIGGMKRQECSDLIDWLIDDLHWKIAAQLNAYQGDNIWQDVILTLDRYDEARTDRIDTGQSNRFALDDGAVILWDERRSEWRVASTLHA